MNEMGNGKWVIVTFTNEKRSVRGQICLDGSSNKRNDGCNKTSPMHVRSSSCYVRHLVAWNTDPPWPFSWAVPTHLGNNNGVSRENI